MKIAGRLIGPMFPPYVVAEMSANHLGQLNRALEIIRAAAMCGCDAVKIQLFDPTRLAMARGGVDHKIESGPWKGRTLLDLYQECAFHFDWLPATVDQADRYNISLFASIFDEADLQLVNMFELPAVKISSFDLLNHHLIEECCDQLQLPVIMSAGMATEEEASQSVGLVRSYGIDVALLHCVSSYPTPIYQCDLSMIERYRYLLQVPVGFSDHTVGTVAATAAVARGASIIEKHMTLSRAEGGPDAGFSLEPEEMHKLVNDCREAYEACMVRDEIPAPYGELRVHKPLAV